MLRISHILFAVNRHTLNKTPSSFMFFDIFEIVTIVAISTFIQIIYLQFK